MQENISEIAKELILDNQNINLNETEYLFLEAVNLYKEKIKSYPYATEEVKSLVLDDCFDEIKLKIINECLA